MPALRTEIHSRQLFDCSIAQDHRSAASFGANEAAAICAISSSLGGVAETPASASRNMVLQNGQAAATTLAPVATNSSARSTLIALAFLFAQERQAAARAATERSLARARRIGQRSELADHIARLIVHTAIAAQIARIVIHDLLALARSRGQLIQMPRQKFAVMLDRTAPGRTPSNPCRWFARNAGRWKRCCFTLALAQRLQIAFGQLAEGEIVAQAPRRIARALFLAQHAEA